MDNESVISQKEKDIENYKKTINEETDTVAALQTEIGTLGEKLTNEDSVKKKTKEYNKVQNKIGAKKSEVDKQREFFTKNDDCPVCEQPIDETFKKTRNTQLLDQSKKYDDAIDDIQSEIDSLEQTLREFQEIGQSIVEKNKKVAALQSYISSLDENIKKTTHEIQKLKDKKKLDNTEKDELKLLQQNLEECLQDYAKLTEQKQLYDYAHELLRDTGIKTKIIKQYVPIINKYVNKYLNELDFLINFSIDENFNETIRSQYRDEFTYSSFSEGEKMRIDLALLFTWRQVAKLKNSVNTNLLIMDEVFDSSLDADGTDAFLKIINTMDENTNVFVISHKGEILYDKFLSTIKFVKEKNFSKIETV